MPSLRTIIDEQMPRYDTVIAAHRIVQADPDSTFDAVRELDLRTVGTPLLSAAMWLRGLPERLRGQAPPVELPVEQPHLADDRPGLPRWVPLGERDGRELVYGAVGRFWQPTVQWRDVPAHRFASFAGPGYGKVACSFAVSPHERERTLLSYECRLVATDAEASRYLERYWWLIRPLVAHLFRTTTATMGRNAAAATTIAQVELPR
jgi:hypothetical protein